MRKSIRLLPLSLLALGCSEVPAEAQSHRAPQAPPEQAHGPRTDVSINGVALRPAQLQAFSRAVGEVPPGRYWYDARSGLWGPWVRGYAGQLPAGLPAPPMPAHCSGGRTGVFVNGRQITGPEYQQLVRLLGPFPPGRYFLEANGNAGREGGPVIANILHRSGQQGGGMISNRGLNGGIDAYQSPDGRVSATITSPTGGKIFYNP